MAEKKLISDYVRGLRASENLSSQEFADKYEISKTNVNRYENGYFDNPSLLVATRFCTTFKVGLDEFVTDFYYTNEKIESTFTMGKHISERFGPEFIDTGGNNVITRFLSLNQKKYSLSNPEYVDFTKEYKAKEKKIFIPHSAKFLNRENEEVWIYRFMNSFEGKNKPVNYAYEYLDHTICNIIAFSVEEIGCKNFVFLLPNKKMMNYLLERKFESTGKNIILIYTKDDKNFTEPILLIGKNFLEANNKTAE